MLSGYLIKRENGVSQVVVQARRGALLEHLKEASPAMFADTAMHNMILKGVAFHHAGAVLLVCVAIVVVFVVESVMCVLQG